jgi:gliding motility-associated-like protein
MANLQIEGPGGTDIMYKKIEAYKTPIVNFSQRPDTVMLPDQPIQCFNNSKHGVEYTWKFGDGEVSHEFSPYHQYSDTGSKDITLIVTTENQCTDSLTKKHAVKVYGEGQINFPNAFKPPKGGPRASIYDPNKADPTIFRPVWEGSIAEYHLQIYNRWGQLLFETSNILEGWNGYYDGRICKQDVYIWKAEGKYINGKHFKKAGDVTLLR